MAALAALAPAESLSAQIVRAGRGGDTTRRVESIVPTSGAPGSEVAVKSGSMPAITPIRIGFGATTGFEALDMILTSEAGEFSTRAVVPEWASWDRAYRFIVFDVYFRPIALSEPFYATSKEGLVYREGRINRSSASCVTITQINGEVHALTGADTAQLRTGTTAGVEGSIAGSSPCATSGILIRITRIHARRP